MWFIREFFLLRNKTCVSYNLRFLFLNKNYNNFDRVFAIQVQTNKLNKRKKLFINRSQAKSNSSIISNLTDFSFFQLEIHRFLPFGIMAGLALAAAVICLTLPETHDQPMIEDLSQDSNDKNHKQDENLNANDVTAEENTLLWSNFFYLSSFCCQKQKWK